MDRRDATFRNLNGTLQVKFWELREKGVGAVVKHAPAVRLDEENALRESKTIRDHSPLALQRAVFYYVGKTFCLWGGREQRDLKISQFVHSSEPDCYTYVENGSKNQSGSNPKQANKVVPVYACPESRPCCLVYLLDTYLQRLPHNAFEKDVFYLHPKKAVIGPDSPWYDSVPVGRKKLQTYLETMCKDAGIAEKKTNYSLQATGCISTFYCWCNRKAHSRGHRTSL